MLRIQNGDFEYSPYLLESVDEEKNYHKKFDDFMKTSKQEDGPEKRVEATSIHKDEKNSHHKN